MSEEIPKKGLGGVVVNEGPNFTVEVRDDLDVPTPGKHTQSIGFSQNLCSPLYSR